ncbi:SCO family protein [Cytobacillus sp. FJAT-54145]|uniref:SCO family protein n=1 Tax=Cytobacillus spartinae TaxID=3299023 RepID=A0ABW6KCX2_9BACI
MKLRIIFIMLLTVTILSACGQSGIKDPLNWPVEDFTFTNQEEQPFGLADLKGKIWVADFIFTNCDDVCLPMTSNMVKLQGMVKDEGYENVEFVSFSVDPEIDSPEVLKDYGEKFNVNFGNYHFLTGYSNDDIHEFAKNSFKTIVVKPKDQDQVVHDVNFFLVDQEGNIMKYYTGLNEIPFDEIMSDIKALQQ